MNLTRIMLQINPTRMNNKLNLISLFPVTIAQIINPNHNKIKEDLINECYQIKKENQSGGSRWEGDTYTTNGTYNLTKNTQFNSLHNWIFKQVVTYALNIGYKDKKLECWNSWFNIYEKYNYQEKHEHYPSDISCVYYLSCPDNCGNLKLYSPQTISTVDSYQKDNPLTWTNYSIKPTDGLLVIFKSNTIHSVEQNKSDKHKISLSLNFKIN